MSVIWFVCRALGEGGGGVVMCVEGIVIYHTINTETAVSTERSYLMWSQATTIRQDSIGKVKHDVLTFTSWKGDQWKVVSCLKAMST